MDRAGNCRNVRLGRVIASAGAYAFAFILGLAWAARPAVAQVRGLPVYNAGVSRGISLSADVGFPNDAAGSGHGYALSGGAGIGLFGITATVGAYNPAGAPGTKATIGGTLNYRLFGGPLIPLAVTLQGGVGYHKPGGLQDISELHLPVGVGFALTVPNPALAIKPWIAPRVDIVTVTGEMALSDAVSRETTTETNFGLSGGLELNFLNGFGLHAAYDFVSAGSSKPGVFGIGAHYALRLPLP